MNRHGDHEATCLCCDNFYFREANHQCNETFSCDNAGFICRVGVFDTRDEDNSAEKMHGDFTTFGRDCKEFRGRAE